WIHLVDYWMFLVEIMAFPSAPFQQQSQYPSTGMPIEIDRRGLLESRLVCSFLTFFCKTFLKAKAM
ncbi:MAG: hypothetical protein MUP33_09575, partial [Polaromonas sp.]|nr:hypothetical protein [Polaromonas sp.]